VLDAHRRQVALLAGAPLLVEQHGQ
jgi:hypothetical protein